MNRAAAGGNLLVVSGQRLTATMNVRQALTISLVSAVIACGGDSPTGVSNELVSINVSPETPQLYAYDTVRFVATGKTASGATSSVDVTWRSSDTTKVTIDAGGLARVVFTPQQGEHAVGITATAGSVSGYAIVTPTWRAPFTVWPDTNVLMVGMTRTLATRIVTPQVNNYPQVVSVAASSWVSSDASVASVSTDGVVTGRAAGHVQVVATISDGRKDTAEVYVQAAAAPLQFVDVSGGQALFLPVANYEPNYAGHSCGLVSDGSVYCWGLALDADGPTDRCEKAVRGGPGVYGIRAFRCAEVPYRLASPVAFSSIAVFGDTQCGVATTKKIYCWGLNGSGELGIGSTDNSRHGVTAIASSDDFISIHVAPFQEMSFSGYRSAGTCGLRSDRVLICWGPGFTVTPTAVGSTTWQSFNSGGGCGIATDSAAYCLVSKAPLRVGGGPWASVAFGSPGQGFCVTDFAGQPACTTNTTTASTPTVVAGAPALSALQVYFDGAAVSPDVCGLDASGGLYCPNAARPSPGIPLKRLAGLCAIALDDKVYCWMPDPATGVMAFRRVPGQ